MTSDSRATAQVGPGLFGLCVFASIVLAVLKLTDLLAISWLVVSLPVIIGGGLTIAMVLVALILIVVIALFKEKR